MEGCNSWRHYFICGICGGIFRNGKTLVFVLAGAVLICATINLLRIARPSRCPLRASEYQEVLHTVVFRALFMGLYFAVGVVWVRSIPKSKSNMAKGVKGDRILLLVGVLVLVQAYALCCYDPWSFFKSAYATQLYWSWTLGLIVSVSLRFWLNSSISLVIAYCGSKRTWCGFSCCSMGWPLYLLLLAFL